MLVQLLLLSFVAALYHVCDDIFSRLHNTVSIINYDNIIFRILLIHTLLHPRLSAKIHIYQKKKKTFSHSQHKRCYKYDTVMQYSINCTMKTRHTKVEMNNNNIHLIRSWSTGNFARCACFSFLSFSHIKSIVFISINGRYLCETKRKCKMNAGDFGKVEEIYGWYKLKHLRNRLFWLLRNEIYSLETRNKELLEPKSQYALLKV